MWEDVARTNPGGGGGGGGGGGLSSAVVSETHADIERSVTPPNQAYIILCSSAYACFLTWIIEYPGEEVGLSMC